MPNSHIDRELHQEFRTWIEAQKMKGLGASDLATTFYFVPQYRIVDYFNAGRNIRQILHRLDPDGRLKAYQNTIIKDYPKVFCILLLIGQGEQIEICVRHTGLCDTHLPFEHKPTHFPHADDGSDFFETFKEAQWQFCVRPLTYNMDLVYEDASILPILTKDQIGNGGSSNIFKITLPQQYDDLEHHASSEKKKPEFRYAHTYVLKTYRTRDAKSYYLNEVSAFRRVLSASSSQGFVPGLIGFHGNFIHGGTHNVILEYADKGTLEQYFQETLPPTTEEDIVSFWRGLFFPIFALLNIHTLEDRDLDNPSIFQGWHQDIKPENILVISNARPSPYKYEFKLADLGLSHFKRPKSSDGEVTDMDAYGTRTYGAPESYRCDNYVGPANLRVSKSVDIWSLGCVYSEAATWLVLGKEGLEQYRAARKAETSKIPGFKDDGCFHNGETILKSVERFHTDIVEMKRKTDHITRDVLYTMIVDMLGVENLRPTAQQLWPKSQRIIHQATKLRQNSKNSKWSSTTESPTSSRNPTFNESPQDTQAGAPSVRQARPTHTSGSKRNTRQENGHFMSENNQIEHSPERMSVYAKPPPSGDSSLESKRNSVFSSSARLPPPVLKNPEIHWSVDDASLWRDGQRKRKFRGRTAPRGGERYMEMISKRDHVFIVDDSQSMRDGDWSKLTARFSLLAYIVKVADPDGLDLYFSSSGKAAHSKKSSELTGALENRRTYSVGSKNMSTVLRSVLQTFRSTMFGAGGSKSLFKMGASSQKRPMTCYILTDGAWCSDKTCDVETVIRDFVDELLRKDTNAKDFGIQFISFGNNPEGLETLEYLDSHLDLERDIVDTETADGNVWKMLLGSINKQFDDDKSVQSPSGIGRTSSIRGSVYPYGDATSALRSTMDG